MSGCVPPGPFQVKANGKQNSEPHKVRASSCGKLESLEAGTAGPVRLSTGMTWHPGE